MSLSWNSDLIQAEKTKCVFMNKQVNPDGYGGFRTDYVEGAEFEAIITEDSSLDAQIGSAQIATSFFGLLTSKDVPLGFRTIFKRISDGQIFRVKEKDGHSTPPTSPLDMIHREIEEYILPNA